MRYSDALWKYGFALCRPSAHTHPQRNELQYSICFLGCLPNNDDTETSCGYATRSVALFGKTNPRHSRCSTADMLRKHSLIKKMLFSFSTTTSAVRLTRAHLQTTICFPRPSPPRLPVSCTRRLPPPPIFLLPLFPQSSHCDHDIPHFLLFPLVQPFSYLLFPLVQPFSYLLFPLVQPFSYLHFPSKGNPSPTYSSRLKATLLLLLFPSKGNPSPPTLPV